MSDVMWLPIASAPIDGRRYLVGRYHNLYGWIWDGGRYDPYLQIWFMDCGGSPTHWLPLPPPPEWKSPVSGWR